MTGNAQLRRATLADVPAVARLLLPARPPVLGGVTLSREVSAGALRLALTHVGLDVGSVWVLEEAGAIVSAVALLPPHGAVDDGGLLLALRLELGLGDSVRRPRLSDTVPDHHWLLLVHESPEMTLGLLVDRAMAAASGSALSVVCPAVDEPEALLALGFVSTADGLLVRPGVAPAALVAASVG